MLLAVMCNSEECYCDRQVTSYARRWRPKTTRPQSSIAREASSNVHWRTFNFFAIPRRKSCCVKMGFRTFLVPELRVDVVHSSRLNCLLKNIVSSGAAIKYVFSADPLHRWFSTNSRTLYAYGMKNGMSMPLEGMSYRGAKNTTVNGIECLPWSKAFSVCMDGYEELFMSIYKMTPETKGLDLGFSEAERERAFAATVMGTFAPDRFGIRGEGEIYLALVFGLAQNLDEIPPCVFRGCENYSKTSSQRSL
jgi:hypothetical protein